MRHKQRSVLETADDDVRVARSTAGAGAGQDARAALGPVAGSMELAATGGTRSLADAAGAGMPGGVGSLRLQGRLVDGVRWSLGGLVAENEGRAWRTAAEFVLEPGGGHEVEVGAGYGAGDIRTTLAGAAPEPDRTVGAAFVRDRWQLGERLTATTGARYTYIGFLPDSHHADAVVQIELRGGRQTLVRGSVATRTLTPGGDLLTLSTVAASPAITWARLEEGLRPARSVRYEVGVDHALGAAHIGAQVFTETTRDLLLTTFDGSTPYVRNAGSLGARGFGVTVGRRFGGVVNGSVTYTFGQGRRSGRTGFTDVAVTSFEEAEFHDLVARLETVIDWSDTRVAALCRLNALTDDRSWAGGRHARRPRPASTSSSRRGCRSSSRSPGPTGRCWWPCATCSTRRPRAASWTSSRFRTRRRGSWAASRSASDREGGAVRRGGARLEGASFFSPPEPSKRLVRPTAGWIQERVVAEKLLSLR